MKLEGIIRLDAEILGGTPVFVGTRAPVQSLFDYLEAVESIDEFLEGFPSVQRQQVIAVLRGRTSRDPGELTCASGGLPGTPPRVC